MRYEELSVGKLILGSNPTGPTAVAGAATQNELSGTVTSEALVTAAAGTYTLTITNSRAVPGMSCLASVVAGGTNTSAPVNVQTVTVALGSIVIVVKNSSASALNGNIRVAYSLLGLS